MAGNDEIEVILKVKPEDKPIEKTKKKIEEIVPVAEKAEKQVSKIGKGMRIPSLEKIRAKMTSLFSPINKLREKMKSIGAGIKTAAVKRLSSAFQKILPIVNKIGVSMTKLPLIGKDLNSAFSKVRSNFTKMKLLRTIVNPAKMFKKAMAGIGKGVINSNLMNSIMKPFGKLPFLGKTIISTFEKLKAVTNDGRLGKGIKILKRMLSGLKEKISGVLRMFGKLGAIGGLVGGLASGISLAGIAKASDENSLRNSRLEMVTNDVAGLKQKTFKASQSSGADYGAQLDSIAKLKMLTKGLFNDDEAVKFTSTLDKAFKVSGTGAEEAKSAMYQLNQAMTSGKLQGDEFRSVMENAPILAQKIAESMGVSMGELKKLGSEGKITSDVIKNAVLGSADEIEAQYSKMPLTFGKVWQQAQNAGQQAMDGLLTKVNQLLNTPAGQKMAQDLQGAFTGLAGMANGALDGIVNIFGKLDFGPLIGPIQQIGTALSQAFSGVGGEGLTNGIANGLNMIISLAGQVAGVIRQMISGINFGQIRQIFSDIGNAVMTLFANIDFGSIGNMLAMAFQQTMQAVSMLTPALAPLMQIFAVIVNLAVQIGTALLPIAGIAMQIGAALIAAIVPVAQIVIGVFAGIVGAVVGVFSAIIGIVASIMGAVLAVIVGIINSIGAAVNKIATFFTTNFNKAKSVAQGAINAIKGFFNGLASTVSSIASKIAGMFNVKPPSWLGFLGGGKGRYIGDKSWEGGPVTVAEKGAEMIRLPSGQQFLANEEMTMNLPQGTRISTAEATRKMMRDQFGKSSKKAIDGKKSSSGSKSNNGGSSQNIFSPTIVVENSGGNDKELTRKIEEILRRFFEEKYLAMGG